MNVFFDVQGTLVSGGVPRPHAREVFLKLIGMGHDVYLWSSAGVPYARSAARMLGVEDIVLGYCSKSAPMVTVDFAVDDIEGISGIRGEHVVPFFDGDPSDGELLGVPDAVREAE
jgi:hypothetical protein